MLSRYIFVYFLESSLSIVSSLRTSFHFPFPPVIFTVVQTLLYTCYFNITCLFITLFAFKGKLKSSFCHACSHSPSLAPECPSLSTPVTIITRSCAVLDSPGLHSFVDYPLNICLLLSLFPVSALMSLFFPCLDAVPACTCFSVSSTHILSDSFG